MTSKSVLSGTEVIEVIEHDRPIFNSRCRRRSIWPLVITGAVMFRLLANVQWQCPRTDSGKKNSC